MSQSPGDLEGAHVAHSLALALSTAAQPHHNGQSIHGLAQPGLEGDLLEGAGDMNLATPSSVEGSLS